MEMEISGIKTYCNCRFTSLWSVQISMAYTEEKIVEIQIARIKDSRSIVLHLYGLYKYLWHTLRRKLWEWRFPGKNVLNL